MPGQPTYKCDDEAHQNSAMMCSDREDEEVSDTIESSMGSLDSLLSEIYDDPASTLIIPDATVGSCSPSPSPPPDGVEETDLGILHDQDSEILEESQHSSGNTSSVCEEDITEQWCPSLYMLQSQAPKPSCVASVNEIEGRPPQYGMEYHGIKSKDDTSKLLGSEDGNYLVRTTHKGRHILSFMLGGRMYNYKLFFEHDMHFVGDKKFDSIDELVEDGLITLYLQKHGVAEAMEKGRHNTLARKSNTQSRLKRKHGKRVKGLKGKAAWDYQRSKSSTEVNFSSHSPTPSPVVSPGPVPNKATDSDLHHIIQSAPQTPTQRNSKFTPDSNSEQSDLDFSSAFRLSTPNLNIISSTPTSEELFELGHSNHSRTVAIGQSSPLAQRRAKSTSSIQKATHNDNGEKSTAELLKDKRYSAIFTTLRDIVKEDRIQNSKSMDSRHLNAYKSDGRLSDQSLADEAGVGPRSYSCSSKAFTFSTGKIRDVSLHGTSTLNRSSLMALAKHTKGPSSVYFKAHKFQVHSYKSPTWCEICHHFLWGLKHQGVRCQHCGMDTHKQCLPIAMQLECFPNKQFVKKVFGVDLTTIVKMEGGIIPSILSKCIEELQSRDLSIEGVYRVSGQSSEIIDLKEKFNDGEPVDLSQYQDLNIITGVIKLYLRELPIPLITYDTYKEIIKATVAVGDLENPSTDWNVLFDALKLLPKPHYNTLKHLAKHLYRVDSHSSDNKMSARNLAVVFAPTLMRAPSEDKILVQDLSIQKYFVECVILKHDVLFQ